MIGHYPIARHVVCNNSTFPEQRRRKTVITFINGPQNLIGQLQTLNTTLGHANQFNAWKKTPSTHRKKQKRRQSKSVQFAD